jgi:NAD(P)-dependent dehydrogenase (short-subunit alcohol dehydrogenase family)
MASIELDSALLSNIKGKTVVITGAVGGIGVEIVRLYASYGANVVVADLERSRLAADSLIATLPDPSRAIFFPANTLVWNETKGLFKAAIKTFGSVEVVVANAGVMESYMTLDVETVDTNGDLLEATEASKVIDINVKGTLNSEFQIISLLLLPLLITHYSFEIGTSSYERQRRTLSRWVKRLYCPRHLHIWICRRHWCRSIRFLQACYHRFAPVITACGCAAQYQSQCCCSLRHAHQHGWLCKAMD